MAELWPAACLARGWDVADRERRLDVLSQAVGRDLQSANELNTTRDYDAVKGALLALSDDANLKAQVRQLCQPLIRLRWAIRHAAPLAYWSHIARSRFGTDDLDQLDETQLTQLRNTLSARANAHRRQPKQPTCSDPEPAVQEPF